MKKAHLYWGLFMFLLLTDSFSFSTLQWKRSYLIAAGNGKTLSEYRAFLRANTDLTLLIELDQDERFEVLKETKNRTGLESKSFICQFEPHSVLILIKPNYDSDVLLKKVPNFSCFNCSSSQAFDALSKTCKLELSSDKATTDGPTFYDSSNATINMENINVADAMCEITRQCGGRTIAVSYLLDEKGKVDPEMVSSIHLTIDK